MFSRSDTLIGHDSYLRNKIFGNKRASHYRLSGYLRYKSLSVNVRNTMSPLINRLGLTDRPNDPVCLRKMVNDASNVDGIQNV